MAAETANEHVVIAFSHREDGYGVNRAGEIHRTMCEHSNLHCTSPSVRNWTCSIYILTIVFTDLLTISQSQMHMLERNALRLIFTPWCMLAVKVRRSLK